LGTMGVLYGLACLLLGLSIWSVLPLFSEASRQLGDRPPRPPTQQQLERAVRDEKTRKIQEELKRKRHVDKINDDQAAGPSD
jgi:hypothetical protein